jgi:uncharacterized membrane protein YfhO
MWSTFIYIERPTDFLLQPPGDRVRWWDVANVFPEDWPRRYRLVFSAMFTTLAIIAISRLHTLLYFYTWWVSRKHLTLIIGNVFWGNWSSVIFLCRWTFLLATVYFWVGNILNFHWVPLCIPMNLTLIHAFTKNHIRRSLPQGCPSTDGERSQVWMDKGAYER